MKCEEITEIKKKKSGIFNQRNLHLKAKTKQKCLEVQRNVVEK